VPLGKNFEERSFIKKELDRDGALNGAEGINMYHFGWRMYDPEIGVWMAADPKGQFWSIYGYSCNPINVIDPDGREFDAAATSWEEIEMMYEIAYSGSASDVSTLLDAFNSPNTISSWVVGYIGNGFENALALPEWAPGDAPDIGDFSKQMGLVYGWPYAHLLSNALITMSSWTGAFGATVASLAKEGLDLANGVILGKDKSLYSFWQASDFRMNAWGRQIGRQMRDNPVPGETLKSRLGPYENWPEDGPGPLYR